MLADRQALYQAIEAERESRVIAYVTSDRQGREAQIAKDAVDKIGDLLDELDDPKKISLILYTQGGDTLAAWSLVNLLREFCSELEVIIPNKCFSAGTLICLGADKIVMAKQSCLGPIDPSVNGPLNPSMPAAPPQFRFPLSVEDVAGFMHLARDEGGVPDEAIAQVFLKLASEVHPLALGAVKRARGQIQALAKKLLARHMKDEAKRETIVKTLCTEAGSHDYAIYRDEARKVLGLNIETPSMDLYAKMKAILNDFRIDMELDVPYSPGALVSPATTNPVVYDHRRVCIETASNGSYHYSSQGRLVPHTLPNNAFAIRDEMTHEGWTEVKA
jgi:hypothetical protein